MTYEETIELEQNVKIKKQADEIYALFMKNVKLRPSAFKDGRFKIWSDSHNAAYIKISGEGTFVVEYRFLHESYDVTVTPSCLFNQIKNKYRGVEHLESYVKHTAGNE